MRNSWNQLYETERETRIERVHKVKRNKKGMRKPGKKKEKGQYKP